MSIPIRPNANRDRYATERQTPRRDVVAVRRLVVAAFQMAVLDAPGVDRQTVPP